MFIYSVVVFVLKSLLLSGCGRIVCLCYFSFIFGSFTFKIIIVRDIRFRIKSVMNGVALFRYW